MPQNTRIVVLGGGYAGIEATKVLYKKLGKRRDVEITLIDKNDYTTLMTELHEVAGGRVEPEAVQISLYKIFGGKRVSLVTDRVRSIDFEARTLAGDAGKYSYDYLIIGVGGEPEFYGIPGIKEHFFTLWSLEDAVEIRRHIEDMFHRAARERSAKRRRELLTFVVAGAGFTGMELAGELKDWRRVLCQKHHIDESEVRIVVVEALDQILPNMPARLQNKARRYLERRGVEFSLKSPIVGAEKGKMLLSGGKSITAETLIWTCGIHGCEFAANLALVKGKCTYRMCSFATSRGTCGVKNCTFSDDRYIEGKRGRLLTNEFMQAVDYANVYIVGDVAWYLEGKKVIPQIVETAVQTGETAARNVAADIAGGKMKPFTSHYHGQMVSLGASYGVARGMGVSLSWVFAIAAKHFINMLHYFGVAGVNQVWGYIRHQFLDIRNSRSVLGDHGAAKVRGFWVAILRVFLGFMWVVEATNKITEGWLDFSSGLSKTAWMFSKGVVQAGVKVSETAAAVDATTAATAAAAAAPEAAQAAVDATAAATAAAAAAPAAAQAATDAVAAATAAAASAPAAATTGAAPGPWLSPGRAILDPGSGLATWFRSTFMDGIFAYLPYTAFQVMIVVVELAIGLALFGGLFTWIAAVVSLGMCIIFTLSGMFAWNQLWFVFAAVLMLGGAGRAFGLDHWVMPWLKKWWNGTRFALRTYLYSDEPTRKR